MIKKSYILSILVSISFLISSFASADYSSTYYKLARGQEYEKLGKYQEAVAEYKKAMLEDPKNHHVYMSLGHIYGHEPNDKKKAIEYYKKGLSYTPTDYGMSLNLMHTYFDVGDFDSAMRFYKTLSAMQHKPLRTFQRDVLAKITINMKDDEVISFCKKYLSINPSDNILREKLSKLYIDRKDYKRARTEFEARLTYSDKDDNLGPIYFGLAVCDYYLGQHQISIDNFNNAKTLDEHVPDQYFEMVREKI